MFDDSLLGSIGGTNEGLFDGSLLGSIGGAFVALSLLLYLGIEEGAADGMSFSNTLRMPNDITT